MWLLPYRGSDHCAEVSLCQYKCKYIKGYVNPTAFLRMLKNTLNFNYEGGRGTFKADKDLLSKMFC